MEETVVFAQMLEDYGYDALHISAGTYETWETIVPPSSWQSGWNLGSARRIKEAVDIPVISVGLFHDPYTIETALKRGDCDAVSLGRQSICDPDFPNKMCAGVLEDIIPCLGCTQRCMEFNYPENLMPGDWGVGCMLNPESSHRADRIFTQTDNKKLSPDVLIMATGATPIVPKIKDIDGPNVVQANDVLLRRKNKRREMGYLQRIPRCAENLIFGIALHKCAVAIWSKASLCVTHKFNFGENL